MINREQTVADAIALTDKAIDLLSEIEELRAVPYYRQAIALLREEQDVECAPYNEEVRGILRAVLIMLDRVSERQAADDVQKALYKLGEPAVILSDLEALALMDWRAAIQQATHSN